jgi:tripartite-type tricarboxylate transporter receptor subunit TctC
MGTSAVMVVNPAIMEKLPYDPLNDFTLIGPVFRNPLIIVATEKSPYRSVKDVVDAAKKEPGKLNWGYPGAGTTQHLTGELFKQVAGVDIQGVMYKGSAQAVQDLLGGQIELSVDGIGPNLPHIKSGKLRALASTGEQRSTQLPDVPTVAEQGQPGFNAALWLGVMGPANMPKPVVDRLHKELVAIVATDEFKKAMDANGAEPLSSPTPDDFSRMLRGEVDRYTKLVQGLGIKLD